MKLYEVHDKTYIKVGNDILFYDHMEGTTGHCKDIKGNSIHLFAGSEVSLSTMNDSLKSFLGVYQNKA